jgi:hypothetical protein
MELAMDKGFDATVVQDMQRWLERAVIGLNLCPFAKAVHVKQQVRYVVCTSDDPEVLLQDLRRELLHLAAADPEQLDTTLLIAPRCLPDFLDFNDFLNQADAVLLDLGLEGDYQIADFHPRYQFADTEVDDMGNFSNRAPYPTLHLLREDSIDRAVEAFPEADAIFEQNIARLEQLGPAGWQALDVGPHLGQQKDAP